MQSQVLVSAVSILLALGTLHLVLTIGQQQRIPALLAAVISLTFGILVWALRAATPAASACGALLCFLLTLGTASAPNPVHSALPALTVLFLLTFLSTRAGKARKATAGLAEQRRGRNAAQIFANLGAAGVLASYSSPVLVLAALAEATADTVSSEIGQAFGGTPFLLTTLKRVPPGTDGAVSLLGTLTGLLAALLVVAAGVAAMPSLEWRFALIAYAGGIFGFLFDSLLGATLERRGLLGNDLVNFTSTLIAPLAALLLQRAI